METITISKREYERMKTELERFKRMQNRIGEDDLLDQVKESLEDVKAGRVTRD